MKTLVRILAVVLAVVVVAAGGFLAYIWFTGGSGEPSAEKYPQAC